MLITKKVVLSVIATLLASDCALAAPVKASSTLKQPPTLTADAHYSKSTPSGSDAMPPMPELLPLSAFDHLFGPSHVSNLKPSVNLIARDIEPGHALAGRAAEEVQVPTSEHLLRQRALTANCVDSSANDTYISSLFYYGGPGATVSLCPGATILTTNAIFFYAANQTLTTLGNPTDNTRATVVVTAATQSCAVYAAGFTFAHGITIQNIQVDGARPSLGIIWGGIGLIEIGGNSRGHTVRNVHAFEPRGWTALHVQEGVAWLTDGYNYYCEGAQIYNNQIGPCGHAPSGPIQFKRDNTGTYTPGQWSDGISNGCAASNIYNNVVIDATDGGIVIFGAQGTQVTNNQIISDQRQLLGGINMVDWLTYGNFSGVVVKNNIITSKASMMKIGIAMGTMVWGTDNRTIARTFGGSVQNNMFLSGASGYFGYSIGIAGHANAVVTGNVARLANIGGVESPACFTPWFPLPVGQAFISDPYTTPGMILQSNFFSKVALVLLPCKGPGPILVRNAYFG